MLAAALFAGSLWNSANAQTAFSFSFTGSGTGTVNTFSLTGSGTITPYGPTTITVTGGGGGAGAVAVSFVVRFGDGSTWTASSTVTPTSATSISGTATISGGTGTFSGAHGTFTFTVTGPLSSSSFNFTTTGSGTITTSSGVRVVPGAWTTSSGTSDPLPILSNSNIRVQELIAPEQFGAGSLLINQIAFRAFPGSGPLNGTITNLAIYLSTSPLFPNTDNGRTLMSATYASNVGPDNTLVYSGPGSLTSPGCAGPSPCPFDEVLTLSTPFFYNPALGSLLVDLQYTGFTATTGSLDGAQFPYPPGGAVARVAGSLSAATGTLATISHVLQFGYTGCTYTLSSSGQSFPAGGGSVNVNVNTPAGCAWTVSGVPSYITLSALSGTGTTTLTIQEAANTGARLADKLTIAGVPFFVKEESAPASLSGLSLVGSMAQIAAEENWTTTFTLVNKGAATASTQLNLFGDPADPTGVGPLTLALALPQNALGMNALNASSIEGGFPPNATQLISTIVKPAPTSIVGSAQVTATGNVDGFAIFHLIPSAQEAVVPLETRNASSYILPFDNTNGVVLAVAVANVTAQQANIGVVIRDATGTQIGTVGNSITLNGFGHFAFVSSSSFPATANKRGTMEFDVPAGGQISVLGIRTTPLGSSTTITTVPALANVGTGGGLFPFLAAGGDGWQTTFVLVNTGTSAAPATLTFLAPNGNQLALPVSFPQSGSGATTLTTFVTQTIAAGASLTIQSTGSATLLTGSAQLSTAGNISGFAIFRFNPTGQEAVVPIESRNRPAYLLAFNGTNSIATGISVSNMTAGTQPVSIPVIVYDENGNVQGNHTLTIPANGEFSGNLGPALYPETANIRGLIEFDAPAGAQIGVLGIRTPPTLTYTSLPPLAR
jgi:hypothetical protein